MTMPGHQCVNCGSARESAGRMLREAQERSEYMGRGKSLNVRDFSQRQLHRWQDMSRVDRDEIDLYYSWQDMLRMSAGS